MKKDRLNALKSLVEESTEEQRKKSREEIAKFRYSGDSKKGGGVRSTGSRSTSKSKKVEKAAEQTTPPAPSTPPASPSSEDAAPPPRFRPPKPAEQMGPVAIGKRKPTGPSGLRRFQGYWRKKEDEIITHTQMEMARLGYKVPSDNMVVRMALRCFHLSEEAIGEYIKLMGEKEKGRKEEE